MKTKKIDQLLIRIILCILPILVYEVVFIFGEPYNYFGFHGTERESKSPISAMRYAKRGNLRNVLIGDSKVARIDTEELYELGMTDEYYYNLAFAGATTKEKCDMFWYANQFNDLKSVVIEINFWNTQTAISSDRVELVKPIVDNPMQFILNKDYNIDFLREKFQNSEVNEGSVNTGSLEVYKEYAKSIWHDKMEDYSFSSDILELEKVINYCNSNNINIRLVAFPMHRYVWDEVIQSGELSNVDLYKAILAENAPLFDMEYPDNIYTDSLGYSDGNHILGYDSLDREDFEQDYPMTADILNILFNMRGDNYRMYNKTVIEELILSEEEIAIECDENIGIMSYEINLTEDSVYKISFSMNDQDNIPEIFYMDFWGETYDDPKQDITISLDNQTQCYSAIIDTAEIPQEQLYFRIIYQGEGKININNLTITKLSCE
ncbi:MAG: hypothetical protein ACI4DK_16100 [Lachnospiraceae bacterium]